MRALRGLFLYLAIVCVTSAFQAPAAFSFQVPNSSMEPAIRRGARVFVEELRESGREELRVGQVVVFRVPGGSDDLLLKRIVAVGGDEVAIRDKKLVRNGAVVDEPFVRYVDERLYREGDDPLLYGRDQLSPLVIPGKNVFLLGDNRDQSYDSRYFGSVPVDAVVGLVR